MPPCRRFVPGALLALAFLPAAGRSEVAAEAAVTHSRSAAAELASFREIWPEFAEQDPTPLVRVFGDGRVVVHRAATMKRRGVYEMWLQTPELDTLLLELTATLVAFDEREVAARKLQAEATRLAAAVDGEEILFEVADAEISVFRLSIDAYRPPGMATAMAVPSFERRWRGLGYDAERFPRLKPIQDLMRAESRLRALADRAELVWVAPVDP